MASKTKAAAAVFDGNVDSLLTGKQIRHVGKLQRKLADAYVNAVMSNKRLEVWLKEVEEPLPDLVEESNEEKFQTMTNDSTISISGLSHAGFHPGDKFSEAPVEEEPIEVDEDKNEDKNEVLQDENSVESLIVAKIWRSFKELNQSCKEEKGSEFYSTWKMI